MLHGAGVSGDANYGLTTVHAVAALGGTEKRFFGDIVRAASPGNTELPAVRETPRSRPLTALGEPKWYF